MTHPRHHFFSLHELLIMASLAALGGVCSTMMSNIRAAVHAVVGLPGGMQFTAGVHVVWLVIAVALVRKPGAATVTGLLKGSVELLSGNLHGLLVVLYAVLAGVCVDLVWLLLGRRDRPVTYLLAGGVGTASNVLVLPFLASLPYDEGGLIAVIAPLAAVAFVSGVLLAGLLGWSLLQTLRAAGVTGARPPEPSIRGSPRSWAGVGVLGIVLALAGTAIYLVSVRADVRPVGDTGMSPIASGDAAVPQ